MYCVKMCRWFYPFVILFLVRVHSLNLVLMATQPLYGIAALSDELNGTCSEHLDNLREAVDEGKVWGIKALDASGKPEGSFIYGNNLWIGSHGQCDDISNTNKLEVNNEKIEHETTPYDFPPYPMGFSMVYIKHNSTLQLHTRLPLEWTIQLGLCVPKSCTKEDIFHLAKLYFSEKYLEMKTLFHLNMEVVEVKPLRGDIMWFLTLPKTILFGVICGIIILLTIIGTVYDVRKHSIEKNFITGHNATINGKTSTTISTIELVSKISSENLSQPSTFGEIVKCFSCYSNTKNLLKTKLSPDSVGCIHGIKFMGMLWVIAVHAIFFQADYIKNVPFVFRMSENIPAQVLTNSTYCVDTYLFLSGFLVTYLYYKKKNPHEKSTQYANCVPKISEFFMVFINRFIRLTPQYLLIILFTDVVYTYYRQTSSLMSFEAPDVICEKYWWRNLLYINNLFPRSEMCLSWSYYLSLDTQFFIVTMFLVILSLSAFKLSVFLTFLLILINIVATTYKSYSIGYIPTLDDQYLELDAIYDLPWNRIGPYLVGAITGYIYTIRLRQKLVLTRRRRIILWIIFPLINLWIIFTIYTRQVSVGFSAVYMGISRTLWGIGLAWVVIACCTGNAPALQKYLSYKGFIPISRLTYCAYLLNPVVSNMIGLGSEYAVNGSLSGFCILICGVTMLTYYLSFLFSVLVESPFILLTKMALKRLSSGKGERKQNSQS